jgi:nucleoside diphosphate kinase
LKALIVIKPQAILEKKLADLFKRIEEKKLQIIGIKMRLLDVNKFGEKEIRAEEAEEKKIFASAKLAPSILVAVKGEKADEKIFQMRKEVGDIIFVSDGEETAKYELERFFEGELFEHEEDTLLEALRKEKGKNYFQKKSIEELQRELEEKKK